MVPKLLTLDEARVPLHMPRATIYLLAQQGKLPGAIRFGRLWRVSEDVLARWIGEQTANAHQKAVQE